MTIARFAGRGEYDGACRAGRGEQSHCEQRRRVGVVSEIVIIGGGPAGYEAALVAAQLDADVTVVEAEGAGGACVLSDCVPSKTFIASSDVVTGYRDADDFGVHSDGLEAVTVDARAVHERVKRLALAQS